VTATPGGVTAVDPATAVVSLVNPEDLTSIRSSFCNQVHYFASPEDARPWLADHPGGEVLPVRDVHRLAVAVRGASYRRCAVRRLWIEWEMRDLRRRPTVEVCADATPRHKETSRAPSCRLSVKKQPGWES